MTIHHPLDPNRTPWKMLVYTYIYIYIYIYFHCLSYIIYDTYIHMLSCLTDRVYHYIIPVFLFISHRIHEWYIYLYIYLYICYKQFKTNQPFMYTVNIPYQSHGDPYGFLYPPPLCFSRRFPRHPLTRPCDSSGNVVWSWCPTSPSGRG